MTYEILLLTLHILGAGIVIGATFAAYVAVWKKPTTAVGLERTRFLGEIAKYGSIWQLLTGLLLVFREPSEFSGKQIFWVKIGLYVVNGLIASLILSRQGKAAGLAVSQGQTPSRSVALTILVLLLTVVAIAGIGVFLVSGN